MCALLLQLVDDKLGPMSKVTKALLEGTGNWNLLL